MSHFFSFNSELYDIHHMQLNWEVDQRAEVRHVRAVARGIHSAVRQLPAQPDAVDRDCRRIQTD